MAKRILVLAANPKDTSRLRLDEEVREIDNGLQRARKRDQFILRQQWAARPKDVRRVMLDFKPNIVHFCGHGEGTKGIAFEDETGHTRLISADALAGFFELFADKVECVFLNTCYSETQAEAIAQHIDYVIGMREGIGDSAAIEFAVAFYDALGAGEPIDFAYRLACNAIQWADTPEHSTPILESKGQPFERAAIRSLNEMVDGGRETAQRVVQPADRSFSRKRVPTKVWVVLIGLAGLIITALLGSLILSTCFPATPTPTISPTPTLTPDDQDTRTPTDTQTTVETVVATEVPSATPVVCTPSALSELPPQSVAIIEPLEGGAKSQVAFSTLRYEHMSGLRLASGITLDFKRMKSFELSNPGFTTDFAADVKVTFLDCETRRDRIQSNSGSDLTAETEWGQLKLHILKVKRVDFQW